MEGGDERGPARAVMHPVLQATLPAPVCCMPAMLHACTCACTSCLHLLPAGPWPLTHYAHAPCLARGQAQVPYLDLARGAVDKDVVALEVSAGGGGEQWRCQDQRVAEDVCAGRTLLWHMCRGAAAVEHACVRALQQLLGWPSVCEGCCGVGWGEWAGLSSMLSFALWHVSTC